MNAVEHITQTFQSLSAIRRAALMPYFTLGYPTPDRSLEIIQAIAENGADLIELGIPFSDPLADGPTIQRSTQVALEAGTTTARCLGLTAQLRQRGVTQPLMLMGYYNPILAYGQDRFVADAASAGANGFIIPDLPPEEALDLEACCRARGLALVYLVAPTSTAERVEILAARASGFLYLVSLTGVTGARRALSAGLTDFIARVKAVTPLPLAVGFGISTPLQAAAVARLADGVIVGSALINAVERAQDPCRSAAGFIRDLRASLSNR